MRLTKINWLAFIIYWLFVPLQKIIIVFYIRMSGSLRRLEKAVSKAPPHRSI